jgi:hypothetical protein
MMAEVDHRVENHQGVEISSPQVDNGSYGDAPEGVVKQKMAQSLSALSVPIHSQRDVITRSGSDLSASSATGSTKRSSSKGFNCKAASLHEDVERKKDGKGVRWSETTPAERSSTTELQETASSVGESMAESAKKGIWTRYAKISLGDSRPKRFLGL